LSIMGLPTLGCLGWVASSFFRTISCIFIKWTNRDDVDPPLDFKIFLHLLHSTSFWFFHKKCSHTTERFPAIFSGKIYNSRQKIYNKIGFEQVKLSFISNISKPSWAGFIKSLGNASYENW
jgi:hypothetical protein